jgi:hypothetical protein
MVEDENGDEDEDDEDNKNLKVYIPGKEAKDQELEVDNSAYEMLHRLNVEWPMLSFDFVGDTLGQSRTKFPLSCFAVGGTESADGAPQTLKPQPSNQDPKSCIIPESESLGSGPKPKYWRLKPLFQCAHHMQSRRFEQMDHYLTVVALMRGTLSALPVFQPPAPKPRDQTPSPCALDYDISVKIDKPKP